MNTYNYSRKERVLFNKALEKTNLENKKCLIKKAAGKVQPVKQSQITFGGHLHFFKKAFLSVTI